VTTLDQAILLAQQGLPVFFCGRSKRPTMSGGFHNATSDISALKSLYQRAPGARMAQDQQEPHPGHAHPSHRFGWTPFSFQAASTFPHQRHRPPERRYPWHWQLHHLVAERRSSGH
jgi:hypothetical protein